MAHHDIGEGRGVRGGQSTAQAWEVDLDAATEPPTRAEPEGEVARPRRPDVGRRRPVARPPTCRSRGSR